MTHISDDALFHQLIILLVTCAGITILNIFGIGYTVSYGRWDIAGLQSLILLIPAGVTYHVLKDYWRHQVIWAEHKEDRAEEKAGQEGRVQAVKEMADAMMKMGGARVVDLRPPTEHKH